jgi:two-component system chemotaxis sensor kinase CheA
MSKESEFLSRLKKTFKGEAAEHRAAMLAGLLELEKGASGEKRNSEIIEQIFREAHSLKGAARAVDIRGIEQLCQSVEAIFSALKQEHRLVGKTMFKVLYQALDLIAALTDGAAPTPAEELDDVLTLLAAQGKATPDVTAEDSPGIGPSRRAPISMSETVRVSAARMGSIFLQAEEMLSVKQAMARHAGDLGELQSLQQSWTKEWANAGPFKQKLDAMCADAAQDSLHTSERVDRLLTEIRTAFMLPISSLLELFPRMVRDLAAAEGKEVTWEVRGEDTQIDRRVLEEIKDPLIHIVRNSISHGIEAPAEREKRGKPRAGSVVIRVERADNDKVELTVSDDGAGIDLAKVKTVAVARGFLGAADAAALDAHDALGLIFLSELSTSPLITDISGRGLGLAIAREKIEGVGGQLSVETALGKGTTFLVQIPLSLATFRGVMVRSRGQTFVIPTVSVDQVLRVNPSMIVFHENQESIEINGRAVSLVNLADVLGLSAAAEAESGGERLPAIVLLVSGTRVAFRIDEVMGELEVLVKNLGRQLARVRNISGATVLATGDVVPVINPSDLMKSVSLAAASAPGRDESKSREETPPKILLAEDSVTSRMLLKSILESAGYHVQTAVDGVEAFAALRVGEFDLLVSDIDMPRMNGFTLCEKVRGNARTADLPIVLVTSLDSREDREKGIEAGANAYLAKSSFDQSNLLQVVKRLV